MFRLTTLLFILCSFTQIAAAQVTLQREDALNAPSRHAWNLFLTVNHPAKDPKLGRGLPDLTKAFGAPGSTVVWETWRLAETELFLTPEQMAQGMEPPAWDDLSLPGGGAGKVPEPPKTILIAQSVLNEILPQAAGRAHVLFADPDGIFTDHGQFGETRVNRATYDFIAGHDPRFEVNRTYKLWSRDGQFAYARDWIDGKVVGNKKLLKLSFPVESIEVKAAWIDLDRIQNMPEKLSRFYIYSDPKDGKKYGLVALHIITKDIPNWFWCTFHFKDKLDIKDVQVDPSKAAETVDDYGPPAAVKGTVWENYKLGGTQTDFITSMGESTLLSDAYIEKDIEHSSCMGCHVRASRSGDRKVRAPGNDPTAIGSPKSEWFIKDGKPFVLQTDFVFSMIQRAK